MMFSVDNQFELGQEVYVISTEKRVIQNKKTCDMCLGVGRIVHRGYEATCPMCHGDKDIILDSQRLDVYIVDSEPHTIMDIRYTNSKNGGEWLMYRVSESRNGSLVDEEMIFATKEEAIAACEKLNSNAVN